MKTIYDKITHINNLFEEEDFNCTITGFIHDSCIIECTEEDFNFFQLMMPIITNILLN